MNIDEWQNSGNAFKMLSYLNKIDKTKYTQNAKIIHLYFIRCSMKLLRFRSNNVTKEGLEASIKFLKNRMSKKDFHQHEWLIEGEAFSTDLGASEYYCSFRHSFDKCSTNDLKMIRINKSLSHHNAKQYLMDLAYFIDSSMAYSRDSSGDLPNDKYAKFLCPYLLRRMFNYPN